MAQELADWYKQYEEQKRPLVEKLPQNELLSLSKGADLAEREALDGVLGDDVYRLRRMTSDPDLYG